MDIQRKDISVIWSKVQRSQYQNIKNLCSSGNSEHFCTWFASEIQKIYVATSDPQNIGDAGKQAWLLRTSKSKRRRQGKKWDKWWQRFFGDSISNSERSSSDDSDQKMLTKNNCQRRRVEERSEGKCIRLNKNEAHFQSTVIWLSTLWACQVWLFTEPLPEKN